MPISGPSIKLVERGAQLRIQNIENQNLHSLTVGKQSLPADGADTVDDRGNPDPAKDRQDDGEGPR